MFDEIHHYIPRSVSGITTKLQNLISPLNRAPHNTLSHNPLGFYQCFQMDRILEMQKMSVRRTILAHEGTFKHQVQELHRIYNLQKKLMHELENGIVTRKKDISTTKLTVMQHNQETETGNLLQAFSARDDPREMSGSCSGTSSMHMVNEQKDLKSIHEETDVEVELTLSVGSCATLKRPKCPSSHCSTKLHDFDKSNKAGELGDESGGRSSIVTSLSVSLCQEDSRPNWTLKDLSLNKT